MDALVTSTFLQLNQPPTPSATSTETWPPPTPTIFPVVTPSGGPGEYRLKKWSEQAALKLVTVVEAFAQDVHSAPMDWHLQRAAFIGAQPLVELAAREALLRFPDTSDRERTEWRILLSDAILQGKRELPDARILTLLQTGLNNGRYNLSNLDQVLNSHGFEIWKSLSAPNLFGDGQVVPVILVSTIQERRGDGIIIAMRQSADGFYSLVKVGSYWMFGWGGYRDVFLEELTGDGIPEIIALPHAHSGSMCHPYMNIWQWREDHFADLAPGGYAIPLSFAHDCRATWRIGPLDDSGLPTIETIDHVGGFDVALTVTRTLRWNGVSYQVSQVLTSPQPEELTDNFLKEMVEKWMDEPFRAVPASNELTVNPSITASSIDKAVIRAESLLFTENRPMQAIFLLNAVTTEPVQDYERFSRPRCHYLLGLAYELVGDSQNAVNAYWQLWHDYPDSPYVLLARAKLALEP
jgi:hypothetical protein